MPSVAVWTGAGTDKLWSNPANWQNGVVPTAGEDLLFPAIAKPGHLTNVDNLGNGRFFNSITFTAPGYSIGGDSLKLAAGVTANLGTGGGTDTLANPISLAAQEAFMATDSSTTLMVGGGVDNGGHTLTVAGAGLTDIQGALRGSGGLTKRDGGILQLDSQTNSFTGLTTINRGVLYVTGLLGAGSSGITVNAGATLSIAGVVTVEAGATLDDEGTVWFFGSTLDNKGTLTVGTAGTLTVLGSLYVQSNATLQDHGSITVIQTSLGPLPAVGFLYDYGAVTIEAGASFDVQFGGGQGGGGTVVNVFPGAILDDQGFLKIEGGADLAVGGTLAVEADGTLEIHGDGSLTVETGATLDDQGVVTVETLGTLTDAQTFTVDSGASLSCAGTINSDVNNNGTVAARLHGAAATMTINGNYTQGASGTLDIGLSGQTAGTQFDQLVVTGTAILGGTLALGLNFVPDAGDQFKILTFGSRNGDFAAKIGLAFMGGTLVPVYNPLDLTLETATDTTTAVVSSLNPAIAGQAVTFTATVTPDAGSGTPTGKIVFTGPGFSPTLVSLSNGQATFTTSALTQGYRAIKASYLGSGIFVQSSTTFIETVQAATTSSLVSSANPSTVNQSVTFTATVTTVAPGSGTPIGTILFIGDGLTPTLVSLVNGQATLTTSTLSVGHHWIEAIYQGVGTFAKSSAILTQTVKPSGAVMGMVAWPLAGIDALPFSLLHAQKAEHGVPSVWFLDDDAAT